MRIDEGRLRRALLLDAERIADYRPRWRVWGGACQHIVTLDEIEPCDCQDARYRGALCKHQIISLLHEGNGEAIKELRRLVA